MELLNSPLRDFFGAVLDPLNARGVMFSLIVVSVVTGALFLFVFERLSNRNAIELAKRQLWARLLAIRLFADDPRIVGQSLFGVMAANGRLLAHAIPPLLVLAPLFVLLYGHFDAFFGSRPLKVRSPRVLTVRLKEIKDGWPNAALQAPGWIAVETPPVHIFDEREISWRIRPLETNRSLVKIIVGKETADKVIDSRPGERYFSEYRIQSLGAALRYPAERQLPPGNIEEIDVADPQPMISCCGIALHWTWWFAVFAITIPTALRWAIRAVKSNG